MKTTKFTAIYIGEGINNGKKYTWTFYRDPKARFWFLVGPDGYERTLEKTWIDSVPIIRRVLGNYGMAAQIS